MMDQLRRGKITAAIVMMSAWLLMLIAFIISSSLTGLVSLGVSIGIVESLLYGFLIVAPVAVMAFLDQGRLNIPWLRLILILPAGTTLVYVIIYLTEVSSINAVLSSGGPAVSAIGIIVIIIMVLVGLAYVAAYILLIIIPIHKATRVMMKTLFIASLIAFSLLAVFVIIVEIMYIMTISSMAKVTELYDAYLGSSSGYGKAIGATIFFTIAVLSYLAAVIFLLRVLQKYMDIQSRLPVKRFMSASAGAGYGSANAGAYARPYANVGAYNAPPVQPAAPKYPGGLQGVSGAYANTGFPIGDYEVTNVGRDGTVSHIVINDASGRISRVHTSISYDPAKRIYTVTDMSRNGTFIGNGQRLTYGAPTNLTAGSVIYLDNPSYSFRLL